MSYSESKPTGDLQAVFDMFAAIADLFIPQTGPGPTFADIYPPRQSLVDDEMRGHNHD